MSTAYESLACAAQADQTRREQMNLEEIKNIEKAWDERKLGAEAEFVDVADASHETALQAALKCEVLQRNAAKDPNSGLESDAYPNA